MTDTRRASRVPRWVKISGIVGLILVLIVVGAIVGSVMFFRDALDGFEQADSVLATVEEQYGPIESFRADPGGAIRADRIEAFLLAREDVAPARVRMEHTLEALGGDPVRFASLRKVVAGVSLLHRTADFLHQRNQVMADVGIGLGEYYYVYSLAYYSWLGRSPGDGPSFKLVGDRGYVLESVGRVDETEVRAYRAEMARASLNRLFLPILRDQLQAIAGDDSQAWRDSLKAEITALEADAHRLPWEDGLPPSIESSLAPYRDRLEQSYSVMCNALEVGLARR